MAASDSPLETDIGPLTFKNPFLLASDLPTVTGEQIRHAFRLGFLGVVTKTIAPDMMEIREVSPRFAAWKGSGARANAIELNVSCPHGMPERGAGAAIGQHADPVAGVTRAAHQVVTVPRIVRLTPTVTDIVPVAEAAVKMGAGIIYDMNTGLSGYFAPATALPDRAISRMGTSASLARDERRTATAGFQERCTSCGRCAVACRDGGYPSIALEKRHVVIDKNRCDGCSLCSQVCPVGVIFMQPRLHLDVI